jgi:dGTP triphosphohydrolase
MNDGGARIRRVFATLLADLERLPERARARVAEDGLERTICDHIAGIAEADAAACR